MNQESKRGPNRRHTRSSRRPAPLCYRITADAPLLCGRSRGRVSTTSPEAATYVGCQTALAQVAAGQVYGAVARPAGRVPTHTRG